MDAQEFVEPVENGPFIAVGLAPGRLHRILWIALGPLHGDVFRGCLGRHDEFPVVVFGKSVGKETVSMNKKVGGCEVPS